MYITLLAARVDQSMKFQWRQTAVTEKAQIHDHLFSHRSRTSTLLEQEHEIYLANDVSIYTNSVALNNYGQPT